MPLCCGWLQSPAISSLAKKVLNVPQTSASVRPSSRRGLSRVEDTSPRLFSLHPRHCRFRSSSPTRFIFVTHSYLEALCVFSLTMIVSRVARLLRTSMHRLRLIVLLMITVALAIALGQSVKSPGPPHSEHTSKGMDERTPSSAPNTKRSTPQIASPLPSTNRCATPISLRVGQIDEQFNIDATMLTTALEKAVHEWNTATGRTLFVLRDDGDIPVNLLFDGRQDLINQFAREQQEILELVAENGDRLHTLSIEAGRLTAAIAELDRKMEEHGKLSEVINGLSDSLLDNPADYQALLAERQRIAEMGISLKEAEQQLIRRRELLLDDLLNHRHSRMEPLKARIGSLRERFSSHLLPAGEHRRGLLVNEINVYTFYNLEAFHAVLLHEIGHALGLPHSEEQSAIMYPVLGHDSAPSNLTPLDIQAALTLCGS